MQRLFHIDAWLIMPPRVLQSKIVQPLHHVQSKNVHRVSSPVYNKVASFPLDQASGKAKFKAQPGWSLQAVCII